jgi:hypothetical protein
MQLISEIYCDQLIAYMYITALSLKLNQMQITTNVHRIVLKNRKIKTYMYIDISINFQA